MHPVPVNLCKFYMLVLKVVVHASCMMLNISLSCSHSCFVFAWCYLSSSAQTIDVLWGKPVTDSNNSTQPSDISLGPSSLLSCFHHVYSVSWWSSDGADHCCLSYWAILCNNSYPFSQWGRQVEYLMFFVCLLEGLENEIVGCFSKTKTEKQKKQKVFCVLYTVEVRTFRLILPSLAKDFLINLNF